MRASVWILSVFWSIYSTVKWFSYYCLSKGLIFHLIKKHNDWLTSDKLKTLQLMAAERTIKEVFGESKNSN